MIVEVEDTVETELIVEVEDTVETELDIDLGESFIGEQGLGIAVIAEEVVSAFDVDIEYESARFIVGSVIMADAIAFEELAQEGFVFDSYRELSSLGFILADECASANITQLAWEC